MSYTLEWQGERLEIRCYGQRLACVPPETASEVWAIASDLHRRKEWSGFRAFCAGVVYGTGHVGIPDVVGDAIDNPKLVGGQGPLPTPPAETAQGESADVIHFPGKISDHD